MTVVLFDYNALELRDFRRDIYLSEGEYSELLQEGNTVSFDVSEMENYDILYSNIFKIHLIHVYTAHLEVIGFIYYCDFVILVYNLKVGEGEKNPD